MCESQPWYSGLSFDSINLSDWNIIQSWQFGHRVWIGCMWRQLPYFHHVLIWFLPLPVIVWFGAKRSPPQCGGNRFVYSLFLLLPILNFIYDLVLFPFLLLLALEYPWILKVRGLLSSLSLKIIRGSLWIYPIYKCVLYNLPICACNLKWSGYMKNW